MEVLVKGDNISFTRYAPLLFFSHNIFHFISHIYTCISTFTNYVFKNYREEIKKIINLAKNITSSDEVGQTLTRPEILSPFFYLLLKTIVEPIKVTSANKQVKNNLHLENKFNKGFVTWNFLLTSNVPKFTKPDKVKKGKKKKKKNNHPNGKL